MGFLTGNRVKELLGSIGGRLFLGLVAMATIAASFPMTESMEFDPEKALAIGAATAAWLAAEWASWNPGPHPHDISLRNQIRTKVFGALPFLRDHDFGAAFSFGRLNPLDDLVRFFVGSGFEFTDPKLEAKRKSIESDCNQLLRYLSLNTFRLDDALHLNSFEQDRDRGGIISEETQQKINAANMMATKLYQEFDDFERLCIRKLGAFDPVDD